MALTRLAPFQAKILRELREHGLHVRKILRQYPPYDTGEPTEVLFVSMDSQPGTCLIDEQGNLQDGPFPGFGT